jgi:hypothetical protein
MWVLRISAFLAIVACIGQLNAQRYASPEGAAWWGGGGFGHASTAEEGMARGMADVIRSTGAANVMNSEAAGNWEDARTKHIDNRVKGTDAYFDMRRMNREARAAESGPRPTQDDMIRYAKMRAPKRPSVSECDPISGQIAWPDIFQEPAYQQARETLEKASFERASVGRLTSSQRAAVRRAADDMAYDLKKNINDLSPQEYIRAKKFVESLSYELYSQQS